MRKIVVALASALVAGLLLGALSRLLMTVVALAADGTTEFTWGGSAGILATYAAAMVPGALLAVATHRRGRWLLLAAGAAFLTVPAVGVASAEVGDTGHFSVLQWLVVGAAGIGVFGTIALLPMLTLRLVDRMLSRDRRAPAAAAGGGPGRLLPNP